MAAAVATTVGDFKPAGVDLDATVTLHTLLSATWEVPFDHECGVVVVEVAAGHSPGSGDLLSWADVGIATSVQLLLPVQEPGSGDISVRPTNAAGLVSAPASAD